VMYFGYWGLHAQTVRNNWGGTGALFQQLVTQLGVVAFSCDGESSSGKGAVSAWKAYKQLGVSELADIEDAVSWLRAQSWVDGERIGISGWSYGGFMTSYALTHSKSFRLGLAGGSVTDWRHYDSIYTERFMLTPKNNKDGYEKTSVVRAAGELSGYLVLVHGAMDDNVHPANTLHLAYELQKKGQPFELMLYPKQQHCIVDREQTYHWRLLMLDAIEQHLAR
jgi:dipeptidyl-peptidase 4